MKWHLLVSHLWRPILEKKMNPPTNTELTEVCYFWELTHKLTILHSKEKQLSLKTVKLL